MIKAVIFDFFGVFCTSIATNWFKQAVPNYAAKMSAFQALCTQSDLGKLSRADFNKEVSKLTGVPALKIVAGIEAQTAINTELVRYAENLKARRLRVACMSNGSHEWTLQVINDHGLGKLFDEIILSGDLGIIKPDPEIYLHTLRVLNITAPEAIFVDDRQANVDAGERLGIRSLLFVDTQSFIKDFKKLLNSKD